MISTYVRTYYINYGPSNAEQLSIIDERISATPPRFIKLIKIPPSVVSTANTKKTTYRHALTTLKSFKWIK